MMRAVAGGVLTLAVLTGCPDAPAGPLPDDAGPPPPSPAPAECLSPPSAWIFCDDFEQDRLGQYFEHNSAGGRFIRAGGVGMDSSFGMRVRWNAGTVSAGALHLAFGRTPSPAIRPVDAGTANYRDIYWRIFVRNEPRWTGGGGDKLSRAQILATAGWAQAMLAPVWSGSTAANRDRLVIDPASGTDAGGSLRTTQYNDNANLRWLGAQVGRTVLFAGPAIGTWHCVEARVRLNAPGQSDGVFQLWVDGRLDAEKTGLNWVGTYQIYGINTVFIENYWNGGAPQAQERYIDRFVVSTAPIGCG